MILRLLAILSLATALQFTLFAVNGDKGMGLDPNGGAANIGAGIDPNGGGAMDPNGATSDGGPGMDPNGYTGCVDPNG